MYDHDKEIEKILVAARATVAAFDKAVEGPHESEEAFQKFMKPFKVMTQEINDLEEALWKVEALKALKAPDAPEEDARPHCAPNAALAAFWREVSAIATPSRPDVFKMKPEVRRTYLRETMKGLDSPSRPEGQE